uniref:Capsid protein n=2 Tax=Foveavirus latensarmeniacae TaxID=75387 RepID=E7DUD8_9VIRU|nr:coat protein [Peach sooty ringspot virus]ADT91619.1 coat protein [Apricot latent virus]
MSTSGVNSETIPPPASTTETPPPVSAAVTTQATEATFATTNVQSTTSPLPANTSSFEFSFTPATSISATPLSFPEPVVSQVAPLQPLQTDDQLRLRQMEAANQGFREGLGSRPQLLSPSSMNPFSTGNAFTQPIFAGQGSNTSVATESGGEPSFQRTFQAPHGVNPSSHGTGPQQRNPEQARELITPFTLGNRAPRRAASSTGGTRRRLDSIGLKSIMYEPQAGVVANDTKMRAIGRALIEMGIREDQLTEVGVYLARHCADVGASDKSTLLGTFPGSDITLEEVGTRIKQTEGCTLRQYCAYYAKHVWNLMLQTQKPPANWVGKEFKFETRYAAFDFFFGVESSASLEPADGLIRLPTQAERVANNTSKEIQMYRIRSMEGTQAVNFGEVTGGKIGPKPVLSIKK